MYTWWVPLRLCTYASMVVHLVSLCSCVQSRVLYFMIDSINEENINMRIR